MTGTRDSQTASDEGRDTAPAVTSSCRKMIERWSPISPDCDEYEVSDLGRVRSVDHVVRSGRGHGSYVRKGRVLKPIHTKVVNRHFPVRIRVDVRFEKGGPRELVDLDQLVALQFVPLPDDYYDLDEQGRYPSYRVRHLNDDPYDCRATNLRWVRSGRL